MEEEKEKSKLPHINMSSSGNKNNIGFVGKKLTPDASPNRSKSDSVGSLREIQESEGEEDE